MISGVPAGRVSAQSVLLLVREDLFFIANVCDVEFKSELNNYV